MIEVGVKPVTAPDQAERLADFGSLTVARVGAVGDVHAVTLEDAEVECLACWVAASVAAVVRALSCRCVAQSLLLCHVLVECRPPGHDGLDGEACLLALLLPLLVD